MSVVTVKAWHCDKCGYEWLKSGDAPERCSGSKRCRNWNQSLGGAETDPKSGGPADRGVSQTAGQIVRDVGGRDAVPQNRSAVAGSSPTHHKPTLDSLRSMIAGIESRQSAPVVEEEHEADITPVCEAEFCGKQLRGVANRLGIRWACADPSCTMFGREQKGNR